MIDFKKPAQEIAEELIKQFQTHTWTDLSHEKCGDCHHAVTIMACVKATEIALQVCPQYIGHLDDDNEDHTKLTEVLEILKSKI